jgi:hypothetical protein
MSDELLAVNHPLAFLSRFSAYEVDADGRITPAPGAVETPYDPFRGFVAGGATKELADYRPPYESFLNVWTQDEAGVLAWVSRHGPLGLPWRETVQDIRDESLRFHDVAASAAGIEKKSFVEALPLSGLFDDVLLGRRGLGGTGVRLLPTITDVDGQPRWAAKVYAPLLIEAFYAMLLLDLASGITLRPCKAGCGRVLIVPKGSRREYCAPVDGKDRCRTTQKKRQQRANAKKRRELEAKIHQKGRR